MKLLEVITDDKIPLSHPVRYASRAILFTSDNLIPLLYVSTLSYHKLPGGGLHVGENLIDGLKREVKEEVGAEISVVAPIGEIIEYRSETDFFQKSSCYIANVISHGVPDFTQKEISKGFELKWTSLDDAIDLVLFDKPQDYEGVFVQKRDFIFLQKAKMVVESKKYLVGAY